MINSLVVQSINRFNRVLTVLAVLGFLDRSGSFTLR